MSDSAGTENELSQCYEHRGYSVKVVAKSAGHGDWESTIFVTKTGTAIDLDSPQEIEPFWATPQEAVRAGIERAVYLLDRRDGVPSLKNPAR